MHAVYDARVPILRRLITWIADRKNRRRDALPHNLHDFPVAKRLSERRESLEKISELAHRQNDEIVLTTNEHELTPMRKKTDLPANHAN